MEWYVCPGIITANCPSREWINRLGTTCSRIKTHIRGPAVRIKGGWIHDSNPPRSITKASPGCGAPCQPRPSAQVLRQPVQRLCRPGLGGRPARLIVLRRAGHRDRRPPNPRWWRWILRHQPRRVGEVNWIVAHIGIPVQGARHARVGRERIAGEEALEWGLFSCQSVSNRLRQVVGSDSD